MTRLSLYLLKLLESLCIHGFPFGLSWRKSTWPVSRIHRRVFHGNEETPLLTAHQLVSWSSPGLTSCRCTGFLRMVKIKWLVQFIGLFWVVVCWQHSSAMQAGLLSGEQLCNPSQTEIN